MAKCPFPFNWENPKTSLMMQLPCGNCIYCLKRRVSNWSFRLMKEYQRAYNGYFITFTYNTDNVPITNNGFMTLCMSDYQKFLKRVRKSTSRKILDKSKNCEVPHALPPLKYFNVGEYGNKYMRPHYHTIMFNVDLLEVEKQWKHGEIFVGELNEASVGYTLKYMMKKGQIPIHKNDDRTPEFQHMSKGLGSNYLTEAMKQWHLNDIPQRLYCTIADGKKISMPRYYKNKIYEEEHKQLIEAYYKELDNEPVIKTRAEKNNLLDISELQKKSSRLQKTF